MITTEPRVLWDGTLLIADLCITHNRLRNKQALQEMAKFVQDGGLWNDEALKEYAARNNTRQSPLIQVSNFDDGKQFIHDGHHRIGSVYMAGRPILFPSEFKVSDWTYASYLEISHENNWYTPFDPRTHCRAPDFAAFKKEARQRFLSGEDPKTICQWIWDNPQLYCEPREAQTISELIIGID